MQVEVCIQDCLTEADGWDQEATFPVGDRASLESYPIALETWSFWFHRWLETLQPNLSPIQSYELSLRLTSDRDIQSLNAQYRQQDQPTDVLAFAALETHCPQPDALQSDLPLYLGDIIISVDTARQQAQTQGHLLRTELAWLASHALLHLLGWDHPDHESLVRMLSKQQTLLDTVGLSMASS
ncbi:MAG: rRNA maturation RNase YbeY [Leptolyngbyaceae cyanobacterium RU_5_1]|nr:rRNA maturation RNase YbeY [Leptolyngbyaceae cyanobacterium RU_5_1]